MSRFFSSPGPVGWNDPPATRTYSAADAISARIARRDKTRSAWSASVTVTWIGAFNSGNSGSGVAGEGGTGGGAPGVLKSTFSTFPGATVSVAWPPGTARSPAFKSTLTLRERTVGLKT